jgi:hypothetical protein
VPTAVLNYQCSSLHEYDANGELCKKRRCNREHTCAHCCAEIRHFDIEEGSNTGKTRKEIDRTGSKGRAFPYSDSQKE